MRTHDKVTSLGLFAQHECAPGWGMAWDARERAYFRRLRNNQRLLDFVRKNERHAA